MVPDGVRSSARVGEFGASPPFRPSFKGGRRMCARTSKRRRDGRATVSGAGEDDLRLAIAAWRTASSQKH